MSNSGARPRGLSFLHTAEAHVPTFEGLVREIAPSTGVRHTVARDILEDILSAGGEIDVRMHRRIDTVVRAAGEDGALVVCTCSTLGGVVEEVGRVHGVSVLRIDRALAETAVAAGRRILVVMTASSTLSATEALFREVATRQRPGTAFRFELIDGVFDLFFAGRLDAYGRAIAEAVISRQDDAEVIVLAQVSMAAAYPHLCHLALPVLVSGRSGVERALSLL